MCVCVCVCMCDIEEHIERHGIFGTKPLSLSARGCLCAYKVLGLVFCDWWLDVRAGGARRWLRQSADAWQYMQVT